MRRRKIRKFTIKQTDKEQTDSSNTEATLILCGSSGERANNLKKLEDLTSKVDLDNETLVDNTERLDKLDRDYKLMELRATETESQVTDLVK